MTEPKYPRTLCWKNGGVRIIDQTLLPEKLEYIDIKTPQAMFGAISRLAVRGAPAIGCAAAYGCLLTTLTLEKSTDYLRRQVKKDADYLAKSRPTAVNLFWALKRMREKADICADLAPDDFKKTLLNEAKAIQKEDAAMCSAIGDNALQVLPKRATRRPLGILTHCNAGALATGGMGTALAVIYKAAGKRIPLSVYADETRPLFQGARLTAWELSHAGIPVTVICDNMASQVMREGKVDFIIVGADRITANGDTANKIGTSGLAILAAHFNVPFYVAAPSSTFDFNLQNGAQIPIEQRAEEEVRQCGGRKVVAPKARIFNPAFDVTPADFITGIITEKGIIARPDAERVRAHFGLDK